MCKISVIIPLYNMADYLEETVSSALSQTFSDLEIILVDDGSTDASGSICDEVACKDARIRVLHKENGGVAAARNAGLDTAAGDYIFFLDSDDLISPETLELMLGACEEGGADIVMAAYVRFQNSPKKISTGSREPEYFDGREALRRMLGNMGYTHGLWNKLYRRELWEGIRFREGKIYEDLDRSFDVVARAGRAAFFDVPLYQYRVHTGSIMHSRINESNLELLDIVDRVREDVVKKFPELEGQAEDLKARTYLKLMKNILDTDFNAFPETQQRIITFVKDSREKLLRSPEVRPVDKIKIRTLCLSKRIFYFAYRIGDLKNKRNMI